MAINSYKDLIVWQKSFTIAKNIYELTAILPKNETYDFTFSIRDLWH